MNEEKIKQIFAKYEERDRIQGDCELTYVPEYNYVELAKELVSQLEPPVSKPFDWQPWEDYKNIKPMELPIAEPPCKNCLMWKPQPKFMNLRTGLLFDGVICCHAKEQHQDFSCFKKKDKAC